MGRPKGSKNKPKPNLPGFIAEPAGRLNVRVSATTRSSLAQLKEDFGLDSQEAALEKAVAIVMALRGAVGR
ncbi:hypothetical protein C798_19450 [Herbaspirillum rubrisubalbicans Os34]|uniref:Toxin-antitoxin system HicB family antitoxin n=1 Tax=Herbaspirillum rubrisubalbicans Os34 TaxID=1235827 RepID=A0A6M3ZVQ9_9BURK|nr:hypothetical protein [Herbaspirillum rubrisubalbicans]QJQ02333.1 hypothetical protein C798_19450 [Herbaspirillum rubrisubalbicans Os34]